MTTFNDNIKTKPLLKLHPISENIYNTRRNEAITDWFNIMANKNYKSSVRKDGTHSFTDFLGNTYFNNGRMISSDGQMADYDYKSLKGNALTGEDLENWKTAMRRLRYKEITLKDSSTAFLDDNGTTYYNNGRMLDKSEPIFGSNPNKGKTIDYDIMGRVKLGKSFRESDNGKPLNSWFTNAMLGMAMAENPAVMTASGWRQNSSGDYVLDKVDDPGVEKLRNNLAVLGTGVTAGIAAPVVGPAVVSETVALKPFLPLIGKNMLAGMFGADVFNATTRAVTGQSFDDYMVTLTPIKDLPISQEWKYMIGGTANPGGWLGFGTVSLLGDDITRTVGKGLNFIGNSVKNNFADGIKYIGRKTNSKDLVRLGRYFKGDNRAARDRIQTEINAVANLKLRIDGLLEQLYKDLNGIYDLNESMRANNRTMVSLYRLLMDAKRRFRNVSSNDYLQIPMRYSVPRFSKIDLNKALDPKFNPKADLVQLRFLNAGAVLRDDGKLYLTTNSNFNLTEGTVKLPKFGTDEVFTFNITSPKVESILPVTNLSTRNATNVSAHSKNVEAVVPEEYLNILNHNINYVLEQFPGAKVFGSAAGVTKAGLPHATNDIDFYILDSALKKYEQLLGHELSWKAGLEDLTKKVSLDNGKYGDAGDIDLNIIYTKPDGTIDFYKGRGLNLFRQLYPDEFQRAYRAAEGDLSKMHYPMDALNVLNKVSVKNTIMDAFESTKDKHKPRALWYLNHGDPDLVYDSLIQHGNSLVGGKMRHAPVTENDFLDPIKNRELLKRMNLKGLVNVEAIAENPKLMRNIFEYWWLNNTVLSRGTSIENMPRLKALELGIPHERDFSKYAVRNSTEWSGGTGGNASGTGLNTVFYGDSFGGVSGNDIYSLLQPMLYGYREGLNPNELIDVVLANFPEYHTLLKEPIEFKGHIFNRYGDILGLRSEISPKDLDELGKLLKIRGIVGSSYGDSRYVGLLSPNTGPDDILFINPAYGRHGKYVSPASARSRDLIHYRPDLLKNPDIIKLLSITKHFDAANRDIKLEDLPLFRKLREYVKPYTNIDTGAQLNAVKSKIDFAQDMRRTLNNEYNRLYGILEILRYRDQMIKDKFKSRALPFTAMGVGLAGIYGMYNLVNNVDKLVLSYYEYYNIPPELQSILDKYESNSLKLRQLERWEKENKLKFK